MTTSRTASGRALPLLAILAAWPLAARAAPTEMNGQIVRPSTYGPALSLISAPEVQAFPVSVPAGDPSTQCTGFPPRDAWAYGDESGRSQACASTGMRKTWVEVFFFYEQRFRRTSLLPQHFTVNAGLLEVSAAALPAQENSARIEISIDVFHETPGSNFQRFYPQFEHRALIQGGRLDGYKKIVDPFTGEQGGYTSVLGVKTGPPPPQSESDTTETSSPNIWFSHYQTLPYRGAIDLGDPAAGGVPMNAEYTVLYALRARASSAGGEGYARAYIGDPLDPTSGVALEMSDTPIDSAPRPRACTVAFDPGRYADNRDGTVTDAYTGLMWQRCPVGRTLSDGGTPADLADDRCLAGAGAVLTWQQALQQAVADATAGHTDWRVPNQKELDSLLAPACRNPAIEPLAFPDTPREPFWSSTPGVAGPVARGLSFLDGSAFPLDKGGTALTRLVRDASAPPVRPLPGVSLGRAEQVLEGDGGTIELVFPVALDRAALADVSVDFHTEDLSATAGEDYAATSGTLVFHPGDRAAEVRVPVLGDGKGEPDETLRLVIGNVSPNARLLSVSQLGAIADDEPRLSVWPSDVYESDVNLIFGVTLSKASASDVSVDYATSDGTATAGSDYLATSGRLTIPAGETVALVRVPVLGDTAVEGDETLSLTLSNPSANAVLGLAASAPGIILENDVPVMTGLADTGVTTCGDALSYSLTCPVATFPGQDGDFGRNTLAFTKLDAAGAALPSSATAWACVRDDATGLTWEVHPDDGGLRDRDWTYTWYRSSGIDDGGSPGTPNGGACVDTSSCDTEKYIAAVNAAGLCGASDWRLPSWEELHSLDDLGNSQGAPNRTWFNDAPPTGSSLNSRYYWTATSLSSSGASALAIFNLSDGSTSPKPKATALKVRLVRGGI